VAPYGGLKYGLISLILTSFFFCQNQISRFEDLRAHHNSFAAMNFNNYYTGYMNYQQLVNAKKNRTYSPLGQDIFRNFGIFLEFFPGFAAACVLELRSIEEQ